MSKLGFTAQEIRDLQLVFDVFDSVHRGYIQHEDLRRALKILGFKVSRTSVQQLTSDIEIPGKTVRGQTDFDSFLQMVSKLQGSSYDKHGEIIQAFEYIDIDEDGLISVDDLKRINDKLKLGLSESELRGLMEEGDRDGDGKIDRQEFVQLMMRTNLFR